MRRSRWLVLSVATFAVLGCGSSGDTKPADAPPKKPTVIDIAVDANRDGKADPADIADQAFEERGAWDDKHGASYLANLDDDDGDHVRDVEDVVINSAADLADLAPIQVAAWPDAPAGAVGTFAIDDATKQLVRIWKKTSEGDYALVGGALGPCATPIAGADDEGKASCGMYAQSFTLTTDEVRAGAELRIEGRRFRISDAAGSWDGFVNLSYSVADDKGAKFTADDGTTEDTATIRVAPWVLFGNLSPFDTVWSSSSSSDFVKDMTGPIQAAGLTYNKITFGSYNDQWTQDYFQTAWTAIPGQDGAVHGMRVANPRPWSQPGAKLPMTWLINKFLTTDRAAFQIYRKDQSGDSFDSHGNHDLIPPYTNGADSFPLGRIVHGSGVLQETRDFYAAQHVQGPPLVLDTNWLFVGHVDEFLSYVPAKTPRGWKLLVASTKLAKSMLEDAQMKGAGSTQMFIGKTRYDANGNDISATTTIDDLLANADLMKWSEEAQVEIDKNLVTLKDAIGLTDDEIIPIPTIFEEACEGSYCAKIAWTPGTVNSLIYGDTIMMPNPFGPTIDGADMFAKDLTDRLASPLNALGKDGMGLAVHFVNDWYEYHILDGEVHCGSNVDAPAPFASVRWWETGR